MKYFAKRINKGFTLIELMIVIAIIAVLAAILVPNFMRARAQSQLVACESNEKNIGTGVMMYATDNNNQVPATGIATATARLIPTYLQSMPKCPTDGSAYVYTSQTTTNDFSVSQTGNPHTPLTGAATFPQYWGSKGLVI